MARRIERAGRRAGRPRTPAETITEYGAALDRLSEEGSGRWREFAAAVQLAGYGGRVPSGETQRQMLLSARRTQIARRRPRWPALWIGWGHR
jgi:hypothetical protein